MLTVTREVEPATLNRTAAPHPGPQPVRLLVVDDHPAVRLGLVQLLEGQHDFTVEAVCVNGEGAVAQAEREGIDVAVVDYHLGGRNGLWVCRALKRTARPPRVIIFSAFANDHLAACSAVAGADAVLNKGVLGSELCDAVRAVARGRRLLPRVAPPMADMLRSRLGDAEQPLFGMLLAGIPRGDIGQALAMSAHELAFREGAILRKLESLPGEATDPRRGPDRDPERLIRQPRAADFRRPATT
jgi:DNA-binding NarL/FixJ family response regulator